VICICTYLSIYILHTQQKHLFLKKMTERTTHHKTCMSDVTTDGVWIGNRIYWTLKDVTTNKVCAPTDRESTHLKCLSLLWLHQFSGNGSKGWLSPFSMFRNCPRASAKQPLTDSSPLKYLKSLYLLKDSVDRLLFKTYRHEPDRKHSY
jgi:hypothetical protein